MAATVPYPYFELEIDRAGALVRAGQLDSVPEAIRSQRATDVFIVSHGWNNDMDEARALYGELFTSVKTRAAGVPAIAARTLLVVGVFWPSKKFADETLIPGGAASADDAKADEILDLQLRRFGELVGDARAAGDVSRARALVPRLAQDAGAQIEFARILLGLLPDSIGEEGDPHISRAPANADLPSGTLLDVLSRPSLAPPPAAEQGGAAGFASPDAAAPEDEGRAAGIGDFFGGVKAGALNLVNYATYYQMKDRAGIVGRGAVHRALTRIRTLPQAPRVHLIGHSFGARVVTAALLGDGGGATTLSLLQGAFSHFGFAQGYDEAKTRDGLFRRVVADGRVSGPIVITHTRNDNAVGIAYAIASRVAGQIAAAVGDADDPYGGLGSNGAQKTPEATFSALLAPGAAYAPMAPGRITNLKSDPFIANHSDIRGEAVAHAILTAVAST